MPFPDSAILRLVSRVILRSFMQSFTAWLPRGRLFRLLYRSTRDGATPAAFHNNCDNQGETVVLVRSTSGHTFGGYSEVAWDSSTGWKPASDAFLFTIVNPHGDPPTMFPLSTQPYSSAVLCHSAYGPLFSYDLRIGGSSGNASKTFDVFDCYTQFPSAFKDDSGRNRGYTTFTAVTNDCYFAPEEVEVWTLV